MSNETLFEMGKEIIELAGLLRVFEKVTILPKSEKGELNTTI